MLVKYAERESSDAHGVSTLSIAMMSLKSRVCALRNVSMWKKHNRVRNEILRQRCQVPLQLSATSDQNMVATRPSLFRSRTRIERTGEDLTLTLLRMCMYAFARSKYMTFGCGFYTTCGNLDYPAIDLLNS